MRVLALPRCARYYTITIMSSTRTWQKDVASVEQSLMVAEILGKNFKGGETIELVSDIGGGKTTFVRGLAKGMGSSDRVSSPSFTLSNEYRAGDLTIYHFDFYRLSEPGIMASELAEVLSDPKAVVVVEWANIVEDVLPQERLSITLKVSGEDSRTLSLTYPEALAYLLNGAI
jgi:tRNA threonylcarbamoyladenosine biosynthesis protein TsaE